MDYGKFCYEQSKSRKKQKTQRTEVKEVRFTAGTDEHDVETKLKQARKFLDEGKLVRITVFHKKRQVVHADVGQRLLDRVVKALEDVGKTDHRPRMEGRNLSVQIVPRAT